MADTLISVIGGLVGLLMLMLGCLVLALRGKQRAVSWKGFGVTFEIRSCVHCPILKGSQNEISA